MGWGGGTPERTQRTGGAAPGVARDTAQARGGLKSSAHPPRRRARHALTRSRGSELRRRWVSRDRRRSRAPAGLAPTSAHLLPALRWPRSGSRSASSPELAITGENHGPAAASGQLSRYLPRPRRAPPRLSKHRGQGACAPERGGAEGRASPSGRGARVGVANKQASLACGRGRIREGRGLSIGHAPPSPPGPGARGFLERLWHHGGSSSVLVPQSPNLSPRGPER